MEMYGYTFGVFLISHLSLYDERQGVVAKCYQKICLKFLSLLHRRTKLVAFENINEIQVRYYLSTLQASSVSLQDNRIEVEEKKNPKFHNIHLPLFDKICVTKANLFASNNCLK